jgi:NifU-like protein
MGWDYTDKVKQHFFEPKNVGRVENPDGVGEVGSIACGDALTLTLKVDKKTDTIVDARFQTFGCGSAIASSSMLTELVKGLSVDEALKITNRDIAAALGGLPPEKMHCSVMGREALEAAVNDYRENKLRTVEDVTNYTKAGGGCGSCLGEIESILDEMVEQEPGAAVAPPARGKLTNLRRIALIQELLDQEVRPVLQKDSGDLEVVDINGTHVQIRMTGHCAGCKAAGLTSGWIEDKLREIVDSEITIEVVED